MCTPITIADVHLVCYAVSTTRCLFKPSAAAHQFSKLLIHQLLLLQLLHSICRRTPALLHLQLLLRLLLLLVLLCRLWPSCMCGSTAAARDACGIAAAAVAACVGF
jgi:hypothetical protein